MEVDLLPSGRGQQVYLCCAAAGGLRLVPADNLRGGTSSERAPAAATPVCDDPESEAWLAGAAGGRLLPASSPSEALSSHGWQHEEVLAKRRLAAAAVSAACAAAPLPRQHGGREPLPER